MEKSSFFNSVGGDRRYDATDWAAYFASFIQNGVFGLGTNNLTVTPGSGMSVSLSSGSAWINGYYYVNTTPLALSLANADGINKRIDRVVIEWSLADRRVAAKIKKGTPSANPVAPALQRDASIYELCVAEITIAAGATGVTAQSISDTRANRSLCGYVISIVSEQHDHNLNDLNGPLSVANGGTGGTNAAAARENLSAAKIVLSADKPSDTTEHYWFQVTGSKSI